MPDGHFRSPQPWNGQYSLKKSASKKVLILKKSRAKIPLVMGGSPTNSNDMTKFTKELILTLNYSYIEFWSEFRHL